MQSATVYRFYQKSMKDMNEQFMVENRLTQIIFPKFEMESGVTELQPCAADDWEEYKKLCTKLNIVPPTMMQKEMCQHYVLKKNQRIIAGMSIMTANINGISVAPSFMPVSAKALLSIETPVRCTSICG